MRTAQLARFATVVFGAGLMLAAVPALPAVSVDRPPGSQAAHDAMVQYKQLHGYLPIGAPPAAATPTAAAPAAAVGNYQPVAGPSWEGQYQTDLAPPDPTGAIGPNSYIQMINLQMAVYNRSGGQIAHDTLQHMTGSNSLSDPQVIWDPSSNRFYYLVLDTGNDTMHWGYSRDSNPTSLPGSFCNYDADFGWGLLLPDYPKLGQTTDFLLIGANIYAGPALYLGADVAWISKPPSGTGCRAHGWFRTGKQTQLKDCDGVTFAATPEPAVQTDRSAVGWIVANPDPTNSGYPSSRLDLFRVTRNPDGSANIPQIGTCVPVAAFAPPSPLGAPQQGSANLVDMLDGRLIHAVSAKDPSQDGALALWTSHTVLNSVALTAEVRWYEIDVVHATLLQAGVVNDPSLYVFNGAISPDRAVSGSSARFGSNMVLGFTTTSSTTYPTIRMVSKVGGQPQSQWVSIKASPGPDDGFDCYQNPNAKKCRWGDYGGAAPDPTPPGGPFGKVWLSNEWTTGEVNLLGNQGQATWRTWNWAATPASASSFPGCHEADGNGDFQGTQRGNFQFDDDGCIDGDQDSVHSDNRGDGRDFQSTEIQSTKVDDVAHTITITGLGISGGVPVSFVLVALESGPTTPGWVSLAFSDGYTNSGNLLSGSIQLQ